MIDQLRPDGSLRHLLTLETLTRSQIERLLERSQSFVRALAPGVLVVGAPYNADGSAGTLLAAVRRFAAELERRFALPVQLVDERFSSLEANEALKAQRASGVRRRRVARGDIDSAAAAVILGRFLAGERT